MIPLFVAAAPFAVGDWIAVARRNRTLEYLCKPATIVALIAIAFTLHPHLASRRDAFVIGLVFSLLGDVFLMLPIDGFVLGLAAFFFAHVAYIVGFRLVHPEPAVMYEGIAVVALYAGTFGFRVLRAVDERDKKLVGPVFAYVCVITVMVAFAIGTGPPAGAAGATFFLVSDTLIAWRRFVRPMPWMPVAIMVTYHVAQALLVASLRF